MRSEAITAVVSHSTRLWAECASSSEIDQTAVVPYRLHVAQASENTFDRLIELGAYDVEVSGDDGIVALMPDGVSAEAVERELGGSVVTVFAAVGRDAESVWVLRPRPIAVGRVRIVPADMAAKPGTIRLIDAAAFGTGLHATTALCIEILGELLDGPVPEAVLDVGTGSGVLALAALTLGVPRALGVDIDREAVRIAAENARLNGFAQRLELLHGDSEIVAGRWPLVLANVLPAPLIQMGPSLVRRIGHHGRIVLSGIPTSVEGDVQQAYRRLGMRRLDARSRGGWVALVLQASW
jgi:ribosomal protein L11 methyltransferase